MKTNPFKKMMLSCRQASALADKRYLYPLSPKEGIQLFFHTRMCVACRSYQRHTTLIDTTLRKMFLLDDQKIPDQTLKAEVHARIIKAMKKE